jgi:N-acetylneuraminic acid mutarotase
MVSRPKTLEPPAVGPGRVVRHRSYLPTIQHTHFSFSNLRLLTIFTMVLSVLARLSHSAPEKTIAADRLADLPNTPGVAAPYVGLSGEALIVAGGTNFPDAPPWKNGTKTWHDTVYVLPSPKAAWLQGFKLPHRMAYGISLTTSSGVLCIGGCDEKENLADVFTLRWDGKSLARKEMPSLPHPTSCAAGALIGSRVFVAGGQAGPDPTKGPSYSYFWSLNLDDDSPSWRELPTWSGCERFYAVAGSDGKFFYLFSGIRRLELEPGKPTLDYLHDAYRYDPATEKWERLPDLPHSNAAVASPAPFLNDSLLLLGSGADGSGTNLPLRQRRSFGRRMLRFHIPSNRWLPAAQLPFGLAAVGITQWNGNTIIASGESRPGVRSTAIWSIQLEQLLQ